MTHHTADILIVGAGPAGCAAAFDLARAGRHVLLLDKRSFPRHKACACGLTRKTLKALRYSVEPVVERTCRDVVLQEAGPEAFPRGVRVADKSLEVRVRTRQPFCATAVRERFDHFCLQQTLAAGPHISLRKIDGIAAMREFATHIELDILLPEGVTETLSAAAVLGADGSNGQMRRLATGLTAELSSRPERSGVERPLYSSRPGTVPAETRTAALPPEPAWYARGFALEATVPYAVLPGKLPAGDAPHDLVFDFAPIAGGYGWLFPKGDHINIGVGGFVPEVPAAAGASSAIASPHAGNGAPATPPSMLHEQVTRTLLADYTLQKLGVNLSTIDAHVTGQYLGLGGHQYVPHGRVLLAGDAAGLVDPLTGEGIHSALVSGQAFAAAVLDTLPERSLGTAPGKDLHAEAEALAAAYARHLRPLRETLAFSQRAAQSFYREPSRGFRIMRTAVLRSLVLKTYTDGLSHTKLLSKLASRVR